MDVYDLLINKSDEVQTPIQLHGALSPTSDKFQTLNVLNQSTEYASAVATKKKEIRSKEGRSMASTVGTLNLSNSAHKKSSCPPKVGAMTFNNADTTTMLSQAEPVSPLNSGEQTLFRNKSMFST